MPSYRRAFDASGCRFFTVSLLDRRETLLIDHVEVLRDAVAGTRRRKNMKTFQVNSDEGCVERTGSCRISAVRNWFRSTPF